jgi:hypothetical protein
MPAMCITLWLPSWLARAFELGWASCPLTQNGCLRIVSQPVYPGALPVNQVAARLTEATLDASHQFWPPADIDLLRDPLIRWPCILRHRQWTHVYLLALAVKRGGRFVTVDGRIAIDAMAGANPHRLAVIRPA